jgi:hypothetical protein
MVYRRRPAGGRHLRATRRPVLVAVSVGGLLAVTGIACALWTVGGLGTAVARTGTFDLSGAAPAVRAAGRDVSISWEQSRLIGRRLGTYRAGGYQVHRYDASGHPQDVHTACSDTVAGPEATLRCVEHDVAEGTWKYAVTPVLGGWTGTEGPSSEVTVAGAALTVASPANGSAIHHRRPVLAGDASTARGDVRKVTVTLSKGRVPGTAIQRLTSTVVDGSWSVRPPSKLPEGVYTARVGQAGRAGHLTLSRPSSFRVDATAPATADDTEAIGDGWKQVDQTVNLSPTDPGGSGVTATYFTTDGSTPSTASHQGTSVSLDEGVHVLRYFSVDRAGNTEAVQSTTTRVRIDTTPPSAASLSPLPDVVSSGQVLTGSGADAQSGVARILYEDCVDAACTSWTPIGSSAAAPDYTLVWSHQPADGTYQIRARVLDAAGNATTSAPQTVRVDNSSPTVIAVTSTDGNGAVEAGDTLTVEMSEPLDPASLPAVGSLTVSRPPGGGTTMTIPGLTRSPVDTGTAAWVADGASVTYSGSLALIDRRWVRFTVGSCQSACHAAAAGAPGTLRFIPAASLRDSAGNAATGMTPVTLTLL